MRGLCHHWQSSLEVPVMRIHVLGLGTIGSLLSHHLRRALQPASSITLIYRTQRRIKQALAQGGAIHIEEAGLVSTASGFLYDTFNDPIQNPQSSPEHIDSLFVTTKAQQTIHAINGLVSRLSKNSTIVLLQNGMGVYEILINEVFRNPEQRPHFILASNTHGAYLKTGQHIVHAGQGAIEFAIVPDISGRNYEAGFLDSSVPKFERKPRLSDITTPDDPSYGNYKTLRETVAALLLLELLNVSWRPISYLQTVMRRKLVVNAVVNPLTALMGCRNGDLFHNHNSSAYNIMDKICGEASAVFKAQAIAESQAWLNSLAMEGIDPNDVTVGRLPAALSSEMLKKEVLRVADNTKHNISSMLSDIRRGRSTEIDFINGYLLNLGATHRVKMPYNSMLLHLIKLRGAIPLDQIL